MKNKLLALRVLTFSICFFGVGQVRAVQAQEAPYKAVAQAARNNFLAGNYEDARKQYEEALTLAPPLKGKAMILFELGSLNLVTKDYVLARANLQQVLEMDGIDDKMRANAQYVIAQSYAGEGDLVQAHQAFALYLEDTTVPAMMRAAAQNQVAQMYADAKDFERARSTWAEMNVTLEDKTIVGMEKTVAQGFKVVGLIGVAQTFADEKNFVRAREALAQAAVLADNGAIKSSVQFDLAQTYVLEKNYAQARVEFNKVLTIEGTEATFKAAAQKRLKMLDDLDALVSRLEKTFAQEAKARAT